MNCTRALSLAALAALTFCARREPIVSAPLATASATASSPATAHAACERAMKLRLLFGPVDAAADREKARLALQQRLVAGGLKTFDTIPSHRYVAVLGSGSEEQTRAVRQEALALGLVLAIEDVVQVDDACGVHRVRFRWERSDAVDPETGAPPDGPVWPRDPADAG
jgi:hypothetical protein